MSRSRIRPYRLGYGHTTSRSHGGCRHPWGEAAGEGSHHIPAMGAGCCAWPSTPSPPGAARCVPSSQHPPSPVTFPVLRTPSRFARRGQSCFPGPLLPPQPIKGRCQRSRARCRASASSTWIQPLARGDRVPQNRARGATSACRQHLMYSTHHSTPWVPPNPTAAAPACEAFPLLLVLPGQHDPAGSSSVPGKPKPGSKQPFEHLSPCSKQDTTSPSQAPNSWVGGERPHGRSSSPAQNHPMSPPGAAEHLKTSGGHMQSCPLLTVPRALTPSTLTPSSSPHGAG